MFPDLALWLTLISLNYHCLKHIYMVPKVFKPLKFYCIYSADWNEFDYTAVWHLLWQSAKNFNTVKFVPWVLQKKKKKTYK